MENWSNYLKEEKSEYTMVVSLKIQPNLKLYGVVFDQIRAIPGITIVKSAANIEKTSDGTKIATLNIKFMMTSGSGAQYLHYVKEEIKKIKDAEGDKILGIRIIKVPEKTIK